MDEKYNDRYGKFSDINPWECPEDFHKFGTAVMRIIIEDKLPNAEINFKDFISKSEFEQIIKRIIGSKRENLGIPALISLAVRAVVHVAESRSAFISEGGDQGGGSHHNCDDYAK